MKMHRFKLIAMFIGLLWIWPPCARRVDAQTEQTPLAQADALVRAGHYQEALAESLDAIQKEPNNFKAYYYAAFALYKQGRLDEAAPYAQKAVDRAPKGSKAEVQRLVDAIAGFRSREQYVQAATNAENNGFFAKAADIYWRAWTAAPDQSQDLGLKAAHIWVERLNEPLRAAEILNSITAHPQSPDALQDAQALLQKIQNPLQGIYTQNLNRGTWLINQKQPQQAIDALTTATKAKPGESAPHLSMARAYMAEDKPDDALRELIRFAQLGGKGLQVTSDAGWRESLYRLGIDSQFATQLRDAYGDTLIAQATALQQQNDQQAATQRAQEQAKAGARERLALNVTLLRQQLSGTFEYKESPGHHVKYPYYEQVKRDVQASANCELIVHEEVKQGSTDRCKYSRDIEVPLNEPLTLDLLTQRYEGGGPGPELRVMLGRNDVKWREVGRHSGSPFNACHYNDENVSNNLRQAEFLLHDASQVNAVINLLKDLSLACAP